MTPEQIILTAVLALLIGRFEACVFAKAHRTPSTAAVSWLLVGFVVTGFVLLWNSLLRSG